ncbi:YeiH family putative sulfate export transporter [Helicobacter anseris]|uniref:YeiH family putative sulfate export transporter n=1 Tax=Helicobacter anseris TaxID=375926 RepID=A0A3D8J7K3_9HELI|nr:putative sulfate exporter family transporter [Helicobacter anseris]RDU72831.1 YeiH family putative sulfate export transporter [Helicobacter anseris]
MENEKPSYLYGILFVAVVVFASLYFAGLKIVQDLHISALLIGVILGALLSPVFRKSKKDLELGVTFSAKKLLRLGIVLYGFKVTLNEISGIGWNGFLIALIVVVAIMAIGFYVGTKFFGLDKDVALLVSGGSAICGAAAVLALESSIKSEPYKGVIAVGTVIIFGLLAMFLYPLLYSLFLNQYLSESQMGIYIGATLHEVANVVGAGGAIGDSASASAITVKMIRVILLVPLLLLIPYLMMQSHHVGRKRSLHIPWFAFMFLGVVILNSYIYSLSSFILDPQKVTSIIDGLKFICDLALIFAMSALGLQIDIKKFLSSGGKAFGLAFFLFIILLVGGFFLTKLLV